MFLVITLYFPCISIYLLIIDSQLSLWTGVKTGVSENSSVALLMCVAVEGFHLLPNNYQWSQDASQIVDEVYPLLYTTKPGKYSCLVSVENMPLECHFEVKGIH